LLSQWNYWCWYMNHGPANLPKPLLSSRKRKTFSRASCSACMSSEYVRAQLSHFDDANHPDDDHPPADCAMDLP
jgi:hypothetical protein